MVKQLPNLLSAARLAVTPYLCFLLWQRQWNAALVMILLAGISDGLDGWLARRFGGFSRWGEVLDPVADKVLLDGAFLTLGLTGAMERWLAALVVGRDVLILLVAGATLLLGRQARRFPPSDWGKASTFAQIALVVAIAGQTQPSVITMLKWTTAVLTALSGIDYAWRYTRK